MNTTTLTLGDAIDAHGIDVLDHLDRSVEIPVHTAPQIQGDVRVRPVRPGAAPAGEPIPAGGISVVRGEAGGNTHALVGAGFWRETPNVGLQLGEVTVPDGEVAYLAHPEHGYIGIGAGTYAICRQREQADEIRMVAD